MISVWTAQYSTSTQGYNKVPMTMLELPFSTDVATTALAAVAIGIILSRVIHNALASPVPWSVPGPFIARFTSKWILLVSLSGNRARTVDALHKKYGPVVRLAPNELSFASLDAVKPIYGRGTTCIKSPIYDSFGRPGVFHMRDPEQHRQRHRRLAHAFSAGSIQQTEPLIQSVVDRVMENIEKRTGKPVDALHWCRLTALEVAGEVLLNKSFGAFDSEDDPIFVQYLDSAPMVWLLNTFAPSLCRVLALLPFKRLQQFLSAGDYLYQYGDDALKEYLTPHNDSQPQPSVLTKLVTGDPTTNTAPLPTAQISTEVSNLIFAGTDTTGNTMTYALYNLASHSNWQTQLRAELRTAHARETGFAFQTLQTLPVLNGVITETLRLYPAAPGALPRVTAARETVVGGVVLPPNTLVSMQAQTTQRNPSLFPNPDIFDPARWITSTKDGAINNSAISPGTAEVRETMFAWGKGARVCLGRHLAVMELKILLARVVERFEVRLAGEGTHKEMEMTDHFTIVPRGGRCGLVFEGV